MTSPSDGAVVVPAPGEEPRTWAEVAAAALAAVRAAGVRSHADIVGVVLSVCDEEAVNRFAGGLLADCRIRTMDFRNGASMDMVMARELAAAWVACARTMLGGGTNYSETRIDWPAEYDDGLADPPGVEMTTRLSPLTGPPDPERYVLRVQRAGRLTPHEARRLAERRADAAEAALESLRYALAACDREEDGALTGLYEAVRAALDGLEERNGTR
jgi:hypothetical protein